MFSYLQEHQQNKQRQYEMIHESSPMVHQQQFVQAY